MSGISRISSFVSVSLAAERVVGAHADCRAGLAPGNERWVEARHVDRLARSRRSRRAVVEAFHNVRDRLSSWEGGKVYARGTSRRVLRDGERHDVHQIRFLARRDVYRCRPIFVVHMQLRRARRSASSMILPWHAGRTRALLSSAKMLRARGCLARTASRRARSSSTFICPRTSAG